MDFTSYVARWTSGCVASISSCLHFFGIVDDSGCLSVMYGTGILSTTLAYSSSISGMMALDLRADHFDTKVILASGHLATNLTPTDALCRLTEMKKIRHLCDFGWQPHFIFLTKSFPMSSNSR